MANIEKVKMPDGTVLNIRDVNALHVEGTPSAKQVPAYNADGTTTWQTISTTDTKMKQTLSTEDVDKPLLFANGNTTATSTATFTTEITGNAASGNLDAKSYTVESSTISATKTEAGGWLWS